MATIINNNNNEEATIINNNNNNNEEKLSSVSIGGKTTYMTREHMAEMDLPGREFFGPLNNQERQMFIEILQKFLLSTSSGKAATAWVIHDSTIVADVTSTLMALRKVKGVYKAHCAFSTLCLCPSGHLLTSSGFF